MRYIALFLVLVWVPLSVSASENPVIARMETLVSAYNAQNAAAIAQIYAPDAVLLAPGRAAIIGRNAIQAHYAEAFAAGARDLQFKTMDIRSTDSNAVEIGETVVIVSGQRIVGRYMHLWQVIDGQILLTRDMYHVLKVGP